MEMYIMHGLKRLIFGLLLLGATIYSCSYTSTPEQYLYQTKVSGSKYDRDINRLELLLNAKLDSQVTSISVDTIFYGKKNRIAFLCIAKRNNKYIASANDSIDYVASCYIGFQTKDSFVIKKEMKYKVTSDDFDVAIKNAKQIYFRELHYMEGMYNINDLRFWDWSVWK